ncbi:response regulator receiver modulated metal dependent phosphohydrolase [Candidatus Magnetobacterium bavaricum]|uniref:diguanylate cyclase n=1 Tax=Candidatus Magnetobacterium bavaricum TaxID=29290 RepID=A0A0F3GID5_9BACT|nr:response regulator receiver modulated metal dependent phosphohydrolase [Candidatus Magnetobacterium bavaricum]
MCKATLICYHNSKENSREVYDMSDELDDLFQDSDNKQETLSAGAKGKWKVMIVDDEPGVHEVTLMILKSFIFEDRGLEFISAYSGSEAIQEITKNPDIALIFLDVVMETDHAGLDVVKHIRETLQNRFVRIILRTGQPGSAPEESVIIDYDINDYKEKNELQRTKIITCTVAAIRSYRDIMTINGNLHALEKLVESSKSLFDVNLIDSFFSEVLVQLNSILTLDTDTAEETYSLILADNRIDDLVVISGTGLYEQSAGKRVGEVVSTGELEMIKRVFEKNIDIYTEKQAVTCLRNGDDIRNLLFIDNRNNISPWDTKLIKIFCANASLKLSREMQVKTILDNNPTFIMIADGESVTFLNKSFLNYLGFSSIEEFQCECKTLNRFLVLKEESFYKDKLLSEWLGVIVSGDSKEYIVHLLGKGELKSEARAYLVYANEIPVHNKSGRYLISFTDVSQMEMDRRKYQNMACTDPLTSIYNRKKFKDELKKEVERVVRYKGHLAIIMFDIDHFKQVNDRYGHQVGDSVLQELTALVDVHIRSMDVFARYGGEEFIILAPGTNIEGASKLAEKLREIIDTYPFNHVEHVTCSFGVSEYVTGDSTYILIQKADYALYISKDKGRNRVSIIEKEQTLEPIAKMQITT